MTVERVSGASVTLLRPAAAVLGYTPATQAALITYDYVGNTLTGWFGRGEDRWGGHIWSGSVTFDHTALADDTVTSDEVVAGTLRVGPDELELVPGAFDPDQPLLGTPNLDDGTLFSFSAGQIVSWDYTIGLVELVSGSFETFTISTTTSEDFIEDLDNPGKDSATNTGNPGVWTLRPVPEPASVALAALGLVAAGWVGRGGARRLRPAAPGGS